jgi:hypothetical protein
MGFFEIGYLRLIALLALNYDPPDIYLLRARITSVSH